MRRHYVASVCDLVLLLPPGNDSMIRELIMCVILEPYWQDTFQWTTMLNSITAVLERVGYFLGVPRATFMWGWVCAAAAAMGVAGAGAGAGAGEVPFEGITIERAGGPGLADLSAGEGGG